MSRFYKILFISLAFFTAGFSNLFAAKIWTGSQSNNWSNASNWQPSGVPGMLDDVVFSPAVSNASCDLPLSAVVKNLSILPGYSGTIRGFNSSLAVLTIQEIFLQQGGVIEMRRSRFKSLQNFILESGSFSKTSGGVSLFTGFLQSGGTCSFGSSKVEVMGNMAIASGSMLFGTGLVEIYGLFVQSGGLVSKPSGNIQFKNQVAPAMQGGAQNWLASTLISNGYVLSNATFNAGNATLYINGNLTIQGSQVQQSGGSILIPPQFGASVDQSELTIGQATFTSGNFQATESVLDFGSGNVLLAGDVAFNTCIATKSNGEFRLAPDGLLELITSNVQIGGSLFSCKNLWMNDAYLNPSSNNVLISGDATLLNSSSIEKNQGNFECAFSNTLNLNSSSLELSGCESIQLGKLQASSSICSFGSSSASLTSDLVLSNGSVFTAPSSLLSIKGNFEIVNSFFDSNDGEINFEGNSTSTNQIIGNPTFYNATLRFANGNNSASFDIVGNVNVTNTLKLDNNSSQASSISLLGGSLRVSGNLDLASYRSAVLPQGDGQIAFTGGADQFILGAASAQGQSILPHVSLDKSAGTLNLSGSLSFGNGFSQSNGIASFDPASQIYLYNGLFDFSGIVIPALLIAGNVDLAAALRIQNSFAIQAEGSLFNTESLAIVTDGSFTNHGIYRNYNAYFTVGGLFENSGIFEVNNGNLSVLGTMSQVDGAITGGMGSVSILSNLLVSGGRFNSAAANTTVNGSIIQSGGEIWGSLEGRSLNVLGDYLQTGGSFKEKTGTLQIGGMLNLDAEFERSSGLVNFNGIANQTIPALAFHRLSVSGAARTITLPAGTIRISATTGGLSMPANCTYIKTGNTVLFDGIANQEISGFAYENLSMARGGIKSLVAHSSVANTLHVGSSTEFNADGTDNARRFTMLSTQNQSARIAPLLNGAFISGNMIVQRYTRGGLRSNRFIGSPVDTAGGVKIRQLKDDLLLYGPGGVSNGYNAVSLFTANNWVFDEALANGTEWRSPSSINEVLPTGKGLLLYHCGTPNQAPINSFTIPNAAVVDFNGVPNQGTIALPIQCTGVCVEADNGNGWNLLANPYASPIDWMSAEWQRSGVSGTIYIWNPSLNQYASFNSNNPAAATNGGSRYIAPAQGFFLKAIASNPVLTINERVKSVQFADSTLFRLAAPENQFRLKVQNSDATTGDEVLVQFEDAATDAFEEQFDALKPSFPDVQVSLSARNSLGEKFAAHVFNTPDFNEADKLIPIDFAGLPGMYAFIPEQIASFDSGLQFILEDAFTGKKTLFADGRAVPVEITNDPASLMPNRLVLRITSNAIAFASLPSLSVYPNPANAGFVQVYTGSNNMGKLQVYSVCGSLVLEENESTANGVHQLDINALAAGVYTVVWNDVAMRSTAKLIKQ